MKAEEHFRKLLVIGAAVRRRRHLAGQAMDLAQVDGAVAAGGREDPALVGALATTRRNRRTRARAVPRPTASASSDVGTGLSGGLRDEADVDPPIIASLGRRALALWAAGGG